MSSSPIGFRQRWNDRIDIAANGSASYQFSPQLPKPCVHPLVTAAGHTISGFEMSDHVWHRGLWFTIKLINGENFWEERPPFGIQASQWQPISEFTSENALRITHFLDWTSEKTGVVMTERRVLTFRTDGIIDWATELHAAQDLVLDRTPFTTWGGYGGLSFRSSRELHNVSFLVLGGETPAALTGQSHDWVVMQGDVDGGVSQRVSIGMIDHPSNPRSPSPWYCKAGNGFNFMNAAFLFHEPMEAACGTTMRFAYRTIYRDGVWTADEFAGLAKTFRGSEVWK